MPGWLRPRALARLRQMPGRLRPCALALLVGIAFCFVPLLRAIDYPLALASAPVASVLVAVWTAVKGRGGPPSTALGVNCFAGNAAPAAPSELNAQAFSDALGAAAFGALTVAAALVLPAAVASVFLDRVCEPLYGLLFVALGPLSSALVAASVGLFLSRFVKSRCLAALLAIAAVLLSAVVPVLEFLLTSGVRFYGTFFGLYHGAIYDEAVFVDPPYLWLRAWDCLLVISLVAAAAWKDARTHEHPPPHPMQEALPGSTSHAVSESPRGTSLLPTAVLAAVAFIAAAAAGPYLGFLNAPSQVDAVLSETIETSHFEIRFQPGRRAAKVARQVADDFEFRLSRVQAFFALSESELPTGSRPRIVVFLYESPAQKARLMGAGKTSVAKPWRNELHVHALDPGANVLAHELVHVALSPVADALFGVPARHLLFPRLGIVEGAAVAIERGQSALTTHQWARAMRDIGRLPDMSAILEGLSFWGRSSQVAYSASGSFVRFLVETYGPKPFRSVYAGQDLRAAYGRSTADLLDEWSRFLDTVPISENDLDLARFVFSVPPVFDRPCPYGVGRCAERAVRAAATGAVDDVGPHSLLALNMAEGDPATAQKLARVLLAVRLPEAALSVLHGQDHEASGIVASAATRLLAGDAAWLARDQATAREIYGELAASPARRWLGIELDLRLAAAREHLPQRLVELLLRAYVQKEEADLVESASSMVASRAAVPEHGLPQVAPVSPGTAPGAAAGKRAADARRALAANPGDCATFAILGLRLASIPGRSTDAVLPLQQALAACRAAHVELAIALSLSLSESLIWAGRITDAAAVLSSTSDLPLTPAQAETRQDLIARLEDLH